MNPFNQETELKDQARSNDDMSDAGFRQWPTLPPPSSSTVSRHAASLDMRFLPT